MASRGMSESARLDRVRHPVRDVVSRLEGRAEHDQVPLRDLLETCGNASFVPALMVPALLVVSPLSGIPLVSSLCGIAIALIALQMLWHRDHMSLPRFILDRELPGPKLKASLEWIGRIADFLDRHTSSDRFHQLVGRGGRKVPQALCVVAGGMMPILEVVPFSSSILGAAVLCFSVSFLTRDGLFAVIGVAIMAAIPLLAVFLLWG